MPKLLIASTNPLTLQTFLVPYARHFRDLGWHVDALASGDMSAVAAAFDRTHTVDWSKHLLYPNTMLKAPRAIRRLVDAERYDLVHVHTPVAAFTTRFALRRVRESGSPKVVYTAHALPFHGQAGAVRNAPLIALEKLAGSWTDYLVVLNEEDEAAARRHRLVRHDAIRRMPGIGVDLSTYSARVGDEEIRALRSEIGLAHGEAYLLCVAEFRPIKRHVDVLKAFAANSSFEGCRHLHLLLAGNGPLLEPMRRLAQDLGISDRVHFLGFRTDVPRLLRGARALVLASDAEGLPRCILEAMIARVPVVGTDTRGTRDLLGGGCGLLVPARSPQALAAAMRDVVLDARRANEGADRAARRVHQFELQKLFRMHEALYEEALSGDVTADAPALA